MNDRYHALVSAASFVLFGISPLLGANEAAAAASVPVTVTNTPLPVQGTVSVGNAVTSPVNVRGVDEPARQPFVMFCGLGATELSPGNAYCYPQDRKSTRLNSSHSQISYAVFCLKKKKDIIQTTMYAAIVASMASCQFV